MSEREELVRRASEGANLSDLSREYSVSRKTAYKWLQRYRAQGPGGLSELSRRPRSSPRQTPAPLEALVCDLRLQHPVWGGRKLHHRLRALGVAAVPAASTITGILRRNGLLTPGRRLKRDWQRFEAERPNDLWQMDFKGHFATDAGRCHPLTVSDDHSRFNLVLAACPDERTETVRTALCQAFSAYGLPQRMLMDNGAPWGSGYIWQPQTHLTVWLMRLGISVSHGRPYHPQTQGKEERFHRTLHLEVLSRQPSWSSLNEVQAALTGWREEYNQRRPHEALAYQTPAARYTPSPRPFPARLPPVEYRPGDQVRRVQAGGEISFRGREYHVGRAFGGEPVALRPAGDGVWHVYYCQQPLSRLDLSLPPEV